MTSGFLIGWASIARRRARACATAMVEPSLACVNCLKLPPDDRPKWQCCRLCAKHKLQATYYCGEECMNAHWPKHKVWHKLQKERAKEIREGTVAEHDRLTVEAQAREAERTGDEFDKLGAAAMALGLKGDYHAAAKAWRKAIEVSPHEPCLWGNLAVLLGRSERHVEASQAHLKAMDLYEDGTEDWAKATAAAFDSLQCPDCDDAPKPEWWNDEALKQLSARVIAAAASDEAGPSTMRARVLCGDVVAEIGWNVGPRKAAEVKEAAMLFRHAARLTLTPAVKTRYEMIADACDEAATPLLAKEKAERDATEREAAKSLAAAEAKATAAAEELLAEEEKEKQQAPSTKAGKAKPGKGKKGKGKR